MLYCTLSMVMSLFCDLSHFFLHKHVMIIHCLLLPHVFLETNAWYVLPLCDTLMPCVIVAPFGSKINAFFHTCAIWAFSFTPRTTVDVKHNSDVSFAYESVVRADSWQKIKTRVPSRWAESQREEPSPVGESRRFRGGTLFWWPHHAANHLRAILGSYHYVRNGRGAGALRTTSVVVEAS